MQNKEIAQMNEQLERLQAQVVLQADNRKLPRKHGGGRSKALEACAFIPSIEQVRARAKVLG